MPYNAWIAPTALEHAGRPEETGRPERYKSSCRPTAAEGHSRNTRNYLLCRRTLTRGELLAAPPLLFPAEEDRLLRADDEERDDEDFAFTVLVLPWAAAMLS